MSYRTVVSVINEHSGSTVTASYAIALAATTKARLILYAAHAKDASATILQHTERHLEHLVAVAARHAIPVTRITEVGRITELLPERALAEATDLVFYPLLPDERYGAMLQTQDVHLLLCSIKANLAIMRVIHMGKPHPHHILVPLSSRVPDPEQRVVFLTALARSFHARITLFHRHTRSLQEISADFIKVRDALRMQHLPVLERSTASGQIDKVIALEAVSHHNDLIVLGGSERGVLQRLFFGNPAGDVLQHPPCNVLLFRAGSIAP